MIDPTCQCGQPPYEDGALCPVCYAILFDDVDRKIQAGEMSAEQGVSALISAWPDEEEDSEETDHE